MKRPPLNFLVDAASFVAFLILLSSGLLLRYQLPPGSGSIEGHGSGHGSAERAITLLWGQSRHDWGEIHFWIAVGLVTVLALHLLLHWRWIACIVGGKNSEASGWRFGLGLASLAVLAVLATVPLVAPTEQVTRQDLTQSEPARADKPTAPELRGSTTLAEAAAMVGVSVEVLCDELGLPNDVSPDERVGPVLRESGKRMSDLHRLLNDTTASQPLHDKETNR
jgi:hypothetical protein